MNIKLQIGRQENADYFGVNLGDIIDINFQQYLIGVVASEIGNASLQACKAQAVASRTYAMTRNVFAGKAISDSGNFMEEFSEDKIQKIISANPNLSLTNIDAIDYLSRRFLIENEMGSFLNAVDLKFQKNRFFVASAIGHTRDAGQYNPKGVLEPMEWIAGISDKTFSNLWSTIRFNDKVIKQKISYGE